MTRGSHVLSLARRAAAASVFLLTAMAPAAWARQAAPVNPEAAALYEFQQRLEGYLKLREELARKLKPLSTTADAGELAARQQALAAALRAARKNARQGDMIPEGAARQITQIVRDDFHIRNPATKKATLEEAEETPAPAGRPVINKAYPSDVALLTMPPLLLRVLPVLPDNLQYRFYNRHVVLLDGDTQLIVDYIPNVLPR